MCIIAYVPEGSNISTATIETLFKRNPNGAGIMWKADNGLVHIKKGFMDLPSLLACWEQVPKDSERAIHCRIATSGAICPACCHPFPILEDMGALKATDITSTMGVMHNGTIRECTPSGGLYSKYSDTMRFTTDFLYPLQHELDREVVRALLANFIGQSRLLVFRKGAPTVKFGEWVFDKGVFYSNESFRTPRRQLLYSYGNDYPDFFGTKFQNTSNKAVKAKTAKTETKAVKAKTAKTETKAVKVKTAKTETKAVEAEIVKTEPKAVEAEIVKTEPKAVEAEIVKTEPKAVEAEIVKTEPRQFSKLTLSVLKASIFCTDSEVEYDDDEMLALDDGAASTVADIEEILKPYGLFVQGHCWCDSGASITVTIQVSDNIPEAALAEIADYFDIIEDLGGGHTCAFCN